MHTIAHTSWGAHPALLRTDYLSLLRPIIEYGMGIYDPRNRTGWRPLERLQNGALRVITGAMSSSPIARNTPNFRVILPKLCCPGKTPT